MSIESIIGIIIFVILFIFKQLKKNKGSDDTSSTGSNLLGKLKHILQESTQIDDINIKKSKRSKRKKSSPPPRVPETNDVTSQIKKESSPKMIGNSSLLDGLWN